MNKELISDKQAVSMIVLFISGSTLMFDAGQSAGEDIWLAIILAFIITLIVSLVYGKILTLFPGKNIFQICIMIFGKRIGSIFCFLYIFFGIYLASLVLFDYTEFMTIIGLNDTPKMVSMISFMFLVMWVMKEGIPTLGKWCEFFIVVLFILIFVTIPLFIPHIDFNNVRPFLYKGWVPIARATLDTFTFPFAEVVLFMGIFGDFKVEKSTYRIYRGALAIGVILVFVSSVTHMLVLGTDEMTRLYFPPYTAYQLIDIADFLTRIEIVVAAGFLFGGFVKITICLIVSCKGICEMLSINNYKIIVTPICILTIIIAFTSFNSVMELFEFSRFIWKPWAVFYQAIMPLFVLVGAEFKARKGNRKKRCNGIRS